MTDEVGKTIEAAEAQVATLRAALAAAIRAAKLAIFVIRKQGVMPNTNWENGFDKDLATATAALAASPPSGTADAVREALVLALTATGNSVETYTVIDWCADRLEHVLRGDLRRLGGTKAQQDVIDWLRKKGQMARSALAQPAPAKDGEQSPLEVVKQEIRDWFEVAEEEIPDGTPMAIIRTVTEQPSGLKAGHLRALIAESADATDSPRMKHLKDHTDARQYLDTGELPKPVQEALDVAQSAVDRAVVDEALSDDEKDAWA